MTRSAVRWRNDLERDGLLFALSLCRKAGKLAVGHDAVIEQIERGAAAAALVASDASDRTRAEIKRACERHGVTCCELPRTMAQLEQAIGRRTAAAAVTDRELAALIRKNITTNVEGLYADQI